MNDLNTCGIFKRYSSCVIAENSYVAVEGCSALVVDPNLNPRLIGDLKDLGVTDVRILLTHEHPDDTCGVPALTDAFAVELGCSKWCARSIWDARNNMPTLVAMMFVAKFGEAGKDQAKRLMEVWKPYVCRATHEFVDGENFEWCGHRLAVTCTPGHSRGSCCIEFDGEYVFSGDSLLLDTPVITRLPGGSAREYSDFTVPFLRTLVGQRIALPGHGDSFEITSEIVERTCA